MTAKTIQRTRPIAMLGGAVALTAAVLTGCGEDPRLSTQAVQLQDLRQELSETRNRLEDAQTKLGSVDAQLETLTVERNSLADALAAANNRQAERGASTAALQSQFDAARQSADQVAASLGIADAGSMDLDRLIAAIGAQPAPAQPAVAETKAVPETPDRTAEFEERIQLLTEERDALRDGWDRQQQQAAAEQHYVQELHAHHAQALTTLAALQQSNDYLQQQVELYEARARDFEAELADLAAELESEATSREALEIATREMSARTAVAAVDAKRLGEAEAYLFELFQNRSAEVIELRDSNKTLTEDLAGQAAQLADVMAERDGLTTELEAARADAAGLQAALEAEEEAFDSASQRAARAERDLVKLSGDLEAAGKTLDEVRAKAAEEVATLRLQNGQLVGEVSGYRDRVKELTRVRDELTQARDNMEARANEAAGRISALQADFVKAKAEAESRTAKTVTALQAELAKSQALTRRAEEALAPVVAQRNELIALYSAAQAKLNEKAGN